MPGPTVGTVKCRGGCGRELDLELNAEALCDECAEREAALHTEAWRDP